MHATVLALRELVESAIAKQVEVIDALTDRVGTDGVRLWVWRIAEDESAQRPPPGASQDAGVPGLRVSCLVFAADLQALELIRAAVFRNPLAGHEGQQVAIRHDPLDSGLLLTLFVAAKVQPRPCLSFVLTLKPT